MDQLSREKIGDFVSEKLMAIRALPRARSSVLLAYLDGPRCSPQIVEVVVKEIHLDGDQTYISVEGRPTIQARKSGWVDTDLQAMCLFHIDGREIKAPETPQA